jgi:hypothetical protein
VNHSVFAMELCFLMDPGATMLRYFREVLPVDLPRLAPGEKWHYYQRARQLLLHYLPSAVSGCWDYFDDHERAQKDFDMWTKGMTTAEGARTAPLPLVPGEPRYFTFTMALLLVQNSPSDATLRAACDVPQARLWQRRTFAQILNTLGYVSFASVFSDVSYLIPRDGEWALTGLDLAHHKFQYLRRLT